MGIVSANVKVRGRTQGNQVHEREGGVALRDILAYSIELTGASISLI